MTLKFPDLSHYKTGVEVSKYPALITKATEGTGMVDSSFAGYRKAAAAAGIPFLPYHFLHHGDITAQVEHVLDVVGARTLMLDVESEPNAKDSTLADVEAFMDAYAARGGRVVLNYIPQWYWSGHWGSPSLKPLEARGAGLISSHYTAYSDSGVGWKAYGGVAPIIWQYTSTPMDMNAFKGTIAELAALFAGGSGQGSTTTTGDDDVTPEDVKAIAAEVKAELLSATLGKSGPTVAVALQGGYNNGVATLAAVNAPQTATVDVAGLAAALAPLLNGADEAAIKTALAEVIGGTHLVVAPDAAS